MPRVRFSATALLLAAFMTLAAACKKGVAFGNGYSSRWNTRFDLLQPCWHYSWNWNSSVISDYPSNVEFVPMTWGASSVTEASVAHLQSLAAAGSIKHLLAFNEPDLASQADMSVEEALFLWPQLESVKAASPGGSLLLGSPVSAGSPLPAGNGWMESFMAGAQERNFTVDFMTLHIYHRNNVAGFMDMLHEVHEQYGLPLWITEFAMRDADAGPENPNRFSVADVENYMQGLLPQLDDLDFVHRYAWFDTSTNNPFYEKLRTAELISEGDVLTPVGELYAKF